MSSNILLINPIKDKTEVDIGNLQTERKKASESYSENPLNKDKEKYTEPDKVPSLAKSVSF